MESNHRWTTDVSRLIMLIGTRDFFERLDRTLTRTRSTEGVLVFYYPPKGRPRTLYSCYPDPGKEYQRHVDRYIAGPYILDPFYQAVTDQIPSGGYLLGEVAPDDFRNSEYYRVYYQSTGLKDEFAYIQRLSEGGCVHLSVGYTGSALTLPTELASEFKAMSEVVNALLLRHWQLTNDSRADPKDAYLHRQLEQALALFGSSLLTNREQAVLQLILHGHSNKAAAAKLGISESTVKLHRKRVYEKFDIGSQAELFHLFIDSLSCYEPGEDLDPLQSYQKRARID